MKRGSVLLVFTFIILIIPGFVNSATTISDTGINISGGNITADWFFGNSNLNAESVFEGARYNFLNATIGGTETSLISFENGASRSLTDGFTDVFIGPNNGNSGSGVGGNIGIGQNTLISIAPGGSWLGDPWFQTFVGDRNIGIGYNAGKSITTGTSNIALGMRTFENATEMSYNIIGGFQTAMNMDIPANVDDGQSNIILGTWAAQDIIGGSLKYNILIGSYVSRETINMNTSNTFIGPFIAQFVNTVGDDNTGLGDSVYRNAAWTSSNNEFNTGVGASALRNSIEGTDRTTAVGTSAMRYGGGTNAAAIGRFAGYKGQGDGTTYIGYQSGHTSDYTYSGGGGTAFIGINSLFLGYRAGFDVSTPSANNTVVIGSDYQPVLVNGNTYIGAQNDLIFGPTGNVGINMTSPQNALNVLGSINATIGFMVGANTGIAGNYTTGSCWFGINGGIITSTNCTAL